MTPEDLRVAFGLAIILFSIASLLVWYWLRTVPDIEVLCVECGETIARFREADLPEDFFPADTVCVECLEVEVRRLTPEGKLPPRELESEPL